MSLLSMPTELLHHTCRFIGKIDLGGYGVKDFRSLSLSCRFFYKFVLPYLYRRIQLGHRSTFSLLRSIVEKPELALAIEKVIISNLNGGQPDLGKAYTLLRKPGMLPNACTRHLHPNDHKAISVLLAEALLLKLSNVDDLSINIDNFPQSTVFFDRSRWKPSSEYYLSRFVPGLKELELYTHPLSRKSFNAEAADPESQEDEQVLEHGRELESDEREPQGYRDIFAQTQNLIAISKPPELHIETEFFLRCSFFDLTLPSIEKLDIWCEGMSQDDFESLLESCPSVRFLQYSGGAGSPLSDDWEEDPVSVRTVVAALRHRQHALESLEIGFFHEPDGYVMAYDTIPDLRQFSRLDNLKLDWNAVFEVPEGAIFLPMEDAKIGFIDKLPRTLEKLRIFQAYEKHLGETQVFS